MEKGLRKVHEHMLALGLGALAHANWHSNYTSPDNEYWAELSVIQAAHAAEVLIKARIAREHPLLIFENLPKPEPSGKESLSFEQLIADGRTYQYADLPARLWATTGIRLPNPDQYRSFGRLRNAIQHFTAPRHDVSQDAVEFIYGVIDPFINECWGLFAADYNEDHEPYVYFVAGLIRRGVPFLVSRGVVEHLEYTDLEWPDGKASYRKLMEKRIQSASRLYAKK